MNYIKAHVQDSEYLIYFWNMIGFRTIHSPGSLSPSTSNASQLDGGFYTDSDIVRVVPVEDRTQRTLDDVRDQVAHELAVRSITKAEIVDGESSLLPSSTQSLNEITPLKVSGLESSLPSLNQTKRPSCRKSQTSSHTSSHCTTTSSP